MSDEKVCVICGEGNLTGKNLLTNPEMVDDLISCCNERLSFGDIDMKPLLKYLNNLTDQERVSVKYHSECRKPLVNKGKIERLRAKRIRSDSPAGHNRGPGRPSTSFETVRPKRTKTESKSKVCIFSTCDFCSKDTVDLHRAYSNNMGETFLDIKQTTVNDQIRACVSDLQDPGDAAALEKWYHRKCVRIAQRNTDTHESAGTKLIVSICDEEILMSIRNSLANEDVSLNMADINREYISILKRYQVQLTATENYRKYLKALISENLPYIQFIKPLRKNEPDNLVLSSTVSKAMEMANKSNDNLLSQLESSAKELRAELMHHRDWTFCGSFEDFKNPPLLQYFLSHLLFGRHSLRISGTRNQEYDKIVDVSCQFLVQNCKSDRQVKHQPTKEHVLRQTVQTPLSLGLPLTIHSRVRDKNLVKNLQEIYIGSDYRKVLELEKRVEQAVLSRMKETGGFCLPDFVKRGENVWFAVDNIDLLEDTPTGQNTFHGTVIVINQQNVDGEAMNPPLVIPETCQSSPDLSFDVRYLPELTVSKLRPIRFDDYKLGGRKDMISNDYTHSWALATVLGTVDKTSDLLIHDANSESIEEGLECSDAQAPITSLADVSHMNTSDLDVDEESRDFGLENQQRSILTVTSATRKHKQVAKQDIMPTWAATKSLMLANTSEIINRTTSEVIAPLFKTSPTDFTTLYTVLMLTQGISAAVVGPERRTFITLDLDLYNRALQIQQTVQNSNWILRAGALHIAFAALHALGKTIEGSGIDTCAIESGIYTSAALRGIYGGKAFKRGLEYHITTGLAILMMKFDAILGESVPDGIKQECQSLRQYLHDRDRSMDDAFGNVSAWYNDNVKPNEGVVTGEQAQFLSKYLEQIDYLLCSLVQEDQQTGKDTLQH